MDLEPKPPADRPASRRRGAQLEDALLDAAWDVLVEHGYGGFTYEAVAARAGTSRPVIYRRWPQREDLMLATLTRYWDQHPVEIPDTGSLREDAIRLLSAVEAGRSGTWTLIGVQLMEYSQQAGVNFNELRNIMRGRSRDGGFALLVARAVARGELPDVPRSQRIVDLPIDLLRHDMLMARDRIGEVAIMQIVDEVWLPLLGMH